MSVTLYNTLTRQKELFKPITEGQVGMYCCGPTVYDRQHLGNFRTFIFEDILHRVLEHAGYRVKHVMNITDVGHLQSDADDGDDKIALAAAKQQKSPWDVAKECEDQFFKDAGTFYIRRPDVVVRATETIQEMIDFIKILEEKGYTYIAGGNVYFDTAKFEQYADFARLDLKGQQAAARDDVEYDHAKKNPQDFVLWFTLSKFPNQIMKWDSPWGVGFPGWHIECSVMASQHLGTHFDIHCGGIDHIPVHHTNEIAQSECCHGHKWVNIWMHVSFLTLKDRKMSKSKGGTYVLDTLYENGFHPLHYRYLVLGTHYRSELVFGWDVMEVARTTYESLKNKVIDFGPARDQKVPLSDTAMSYAKKFWDSCMDDINTPVALSHMWMMIKDSSLHPSEKYQLLLEFDMVLGLDIASMADTQIPDQVKELITAREQARIKKDWALSDQLRDQIAGFGVVIKDTADGPVWIKKSV